MSASEAQRRGVRPLARSSATASYAHEPEWFTTAPAGAIQSAHAARWKAGDVQLYEVNEAFAAVTMAAMRDVGLEHARTQRQRRRMRARSSRSAPPARASSRRWCMRYEPAVAARHRLLMYRRWRSDAIAVEVAA
jgi:hypothetical protein